MRRGDARDREKMIKYTCVFFKILPSQHGRMGWMSYGIEFSDVHE